MVQYDFDAFAALNITLYYVSCPLGWLESIGFEGHLEIVKKLIEAKANVNQANKVGMASVLR